ncbi:MAG: hypothetical protein FD129_448, partial [bacterium]
MRDTGSGVGKAGRPGGSAPGPGANSPDSGAVAPRSYQVFTDGASRGNPGHAG